MRLHGHNEFPYGLCAVLGCREYHISERALCSGHELLYIANHGHSSPPCVSGADWLTLIHQGVFSELAYTIYPRMDT
jgi:hypothetical protein